MKKLVLCFKFMIFVTSSDNIAGTNQFASQKGMTFGGVRHVADIRADDMNVDSKQVLHPQSGKFDLISALDGYKLIFQQMIFRVFKSSFVEYCFYCQYSKN